MDNVRERINEQNASRKRKILLGVIAVVAIVVIAIMLEGHIGNRITDVEIMKSNITDERATFISLDALDTNIIAVKASDETYRLAFDDCKGCYYADGKHAHFQNNADNTGLICENCKSEIMYDDMGFLPEESMPFPIEIVEIQEEKDRFILPAKYLENKKEILEEMRKGNIENSYSEKTVDRK